MTANKLTQQILAYCRLQGHFVYRNSGSPAGTRRRNIMTKGVPDIVGCTKKGIALGIEVKVGEDKMSQAQIEFENHYKKRGGIYIVARRLEDVTEKL